MKKITVTSQEKANYLLVMACRDNSLETIIDLFTSPDYSFKPDIHCNADICFNLILKFPKLVHYFIMDLNIPLTSNIEKMIIDREDIQQLFQRRKLYVQLNKEMILSPSVSFQKSKI